MNRREFVGGVSALWYTMEMQQIRLGDSNTVIIGDDRLRVVLEPSASGLREIRYEVDGTPVADVTGEAWNLVLGTSVFSSTDTAASLVKRDGERLAIFEGNTGGCRWRMQYAVTGHGRVTKTLTLVPSSKVELARASLWKTTAKVAAKSAGSDLQTIALFYRDGNHGLFASIDFPYAELTGEGGVAQLSYPPHDQLEAGKPYECHSLTIGAVRLTGRVRSGYDEGEIHAVDTYVQEHRRPRFERPMFIYASIINRYTQPANGAVFYTMKDQPTFSFNTDLVERDLMLMQGLGTEYYQLFPGVFDWIPGDPEPKVVDQLVNDARKRHLRLGDYSACASLFVSHFNVHNNVPTGWQTAACFGDSTFVAHYIATVVSNCKRFGFELHCLDGLEISPCNNASHGHATGADSIYAQIRGLTRLIEAINTVSPQMLVWPNAGSGWLKLMPKLTWYAPNQYLTDPSMDAPRPGLNMTRLLDDARREQMVSVHNSTFVPYRFFSNLQYFFSQNSVVPDIRNFEYGMLATVAVTPNLSFGEIRPWLDRLAATDADRVMAFYDRWTTFLNRHYDLWKRTYQAGEDPGVGSVEIYSHAAADHGYIFLINSNYWDRTVEVPLDATLGFAEHGQVEIRELYPAERLRLTAQGPFAQLGTRLPMHVPAQQVIVLEVQPAPAVIREARLYGVPGRMTSSPTGYQISTKGPQGQTERIGVVLPPGRPPITTSALRKMTLPDPRLYEPTSLKLVASRSEGALLEVTFPRMKAPTELRDWQVRPGDLASNWTSGIPERATALRFPLFTDVTDVNVQMPMTDERADALRLGVLGDFCGAYVENAFGELQQVMIEVEAGGSAVTSADPVVSGETRPDLRPLHALARSEEKKWWLQTTFNLPMMYGYGCEPAPDDHTLLVIPFIRQGRFKQVSAWVNNERLNVERYAYPRSRGYACYYADLVGTGAHDGNNTLVVYLEV